jgi:hypothetical protein
MIQTFAALKSKASFCAICASRYFKHRIGQTVLVCRWTGAQESNGGTGIAVTIRIARVQAAARRPTMNEPDFFDLTSTSEQIFQEIEALRKRHGFSEETIACALLEMAEWYAGEPLPIELGEPEPDEVLFA